MDFLTDQNPFEGRGKLYVELFSQGYKYHSLSSY